MNLRQLVAKTNADSSLSQLVDLSLIFGSQSEAGNSELSNARNLRNYAFAFHPHTYTHTPTQFAGQLITFFINQIAASKCKFHYTSQPPATCSLCLILINIKCRV